MQLKKKELTMKTKRTILTIVFVLSLTFILGACGAEETPEPEPVETVTLDYVVAEGHLVPVRDLRLNFSAQGRVDRILVQEGESVSEGQTLIELGDQESAQASLKAAELELTTAQQDLEDFQRTSDLSTAQAWQDYLDAQQQRAEAERTWEDLDLDALEEDIDDARIEVEEREEDLEDAQEELEKYQDVDEDNPDREAAEDDVEEAREDLNEAQRLLEEAEREIDRPRAALDAALAAEEEALREYELREEEGLDPDQLTILEARVTAAEARLQAAEKGLANHTLEAPFAGTVTDVYLETGELVGPQSPAVQLADLSDMVIETSDLTELEVVRIEEGQTVDILPDALPGTTLKGTVTRIGESFRTQAGDILYKVMVEMEESDPALRWGMTVELRFLNE